MISLSHNLIVLFAQGRGGQHSALFVAKSTMSSSLLTIGQHKAMDIKPECIISSSVEYDPIKSEATDDEDMCNDSNTSNSQNHLLPIAIKH